jgi:hypothetical protein
MPDPDQIAVLAVDFHLNGLPVPHFDTQVRGRSL